MNTPVEELTKRQREILNLMAKGLGAKQIAAEKRISEECVKEYKKAIFRNLGAINSINAVAIGKDKGLI